MNGDNMIGHHLVNKSMHCFQSWWRKFKLGSQFSSCKTYFVWTTLAIFRQKYYQRGKKKLLFYQNSDWNAPLINWWVYYNLCIKNNHPPPETEALQNPSNESSNKVCHRIWPDTPFWLQIVCWWLPSSNSITEKKMATIHPQCCPQVVARGDFSTYSCLLHLLFQIL